MKFPACIGGSLAFAEFIRQRLLTRTDIMTALEIKTIRTTTKRKELIAWHQGEAKIIWR